MEKSFKSKDKILVHLIGFNEYKEEYSKPIETTQGGMSERLNLSQNTISYALRDLKDKDLVKENASRVKGKKQSMKTYFLTEDGAKKAKRVKKEMEKTPIQIDLYGEKRTIKAGKVQKYFSEDVNIVDIIIDQEKEGIEIKVGEEDGSPVHHREELPKIPPGIDLEIDKLEKWYGESNKPAVLEMSSSLVLSKMTEYLEDNTNIFHFKVEPHKFPIHLWESLSNFLRKMNRLSLHNYRKYTNWVNPRTSIKKLTNDLEYASCVLIFESIEKSERLKEIILEIIEKVNDFRQVKIILTSDDFQSIDPSIPIQRIDLKENTTNLKKRLQNRYEGSFEEIIKNRLNYPISLSLDYLSIFRYPISEDELLRLEPIDENRLKKVMKLPLIYRTYEEKVTLPGNVIKNKLLNMSEEMKENLHFLASKYYQREKDSKVEHEIEMLYHLIQSSNLDKAKRVLGDVGENILSSGYSDVILSLLDNIDKSNEENIFIFYRAEAKRINRDYESSKKLYKKILDANSDKWELKSYLGLGKVEEKLGNFEQAIYDLNEAEKLVKKIDEESQKKDILGKIYARRGEIWNKNDNYEKARKDLRKAIETLVHEEDHHLLTSSYFILARMEKEQGKLEEAIEPFKMGLETWTKLSPKYDEGMRKQQRDLSTLYKVLKELEDAEIRFRTDYRAERYGPIQEEYEDLKTASLLSLAECHMENESFEKAIEVAKNAEEALLEEDKRERAFTQALLGRAFLETGQELKAEDHLSKAISLYQELNQSYQLALTYFSMAKVQEAKEDGDAVAEYYRKAILSFSKSGAEQEAERVKRKIENIPISM